MRPVGSDASPILGPCMLRCESLSATCTLKPFLPLGPTYNDNLIELLLHFRQISLHGLHSNVRSSF